MKSQTQITYQFKLSEAEYTILAELVMAGWQPVMQPTATDRIVDQVAEDFLRYSNISVEDVEEEDEIVEDALEDPAEDEAPVRPTPFLKRLRRHVS